MTAGAEPETRLLEPGSLLIRAYASLGRGGPPLPTHHADEWRQPMPPKCSGTVDQVGEAVANSAGDEQCGQRLFRHIALDIPSHADPLVIKACSCATG
jgi:hypothetical protein